LGAAAGKVSLILFPLFCPMFNVLLNAVIQHIFKQVQSPTFLSLLPTRAHISVSYQQMRTFVCPDISPPLQLAINRFSILIAQNKGSWEKK
jgi:hypothetical protein